MKTVFEEKVAKIQKTHQEYDEFITSISQEIEAKIDAGIKERLAIEKLAQEEAEIRSDFSSDYYKYAWESGFVAGYIKANETRLKAFIEEFKQKYGQK